MTFEMPDEGFVYLPVTLPFGGIASMQRAVLGGAFRVSLPKFALPHEPQIYDISHRTLRDAVISS